jgi:hypothetical protein
VDCGVYCAPPLSHINRAHICKPFKEPKNRFPAWRVRQPYLLILSARLHRLHGGIDFSVSIPGLLKRLQILAQFNTPPPPHQQLLPPPFQHRQLIALAHSPILIIILVT